MTERSQQADEESDHNYQGDSVVDRSTKEDGRAGDDDLEVEAGEHQAARQTGCQLKEIEPAETTRGNESMGLPFR